MRWIAISGSRYNLTSAIREEVKAVINEILDNGDAIVTGGSSGVDQIATDIILLRDPQRLKIIIPTSLLDYIKHYRSGHPDDTMTEEEADAVEGQLRDAITHQALIEMDHSEVTIDTHCDRNQSIIDEADELIAFRVNNSIGTSDAIDRAHNAGLPVKVYDYRV